MKKQLLIISLGLLCGALTISDSFARGSSRDRDQHPARSYQNNSRTREKSYSSFFLGSRGSGFSINLNNKKVGLSINLGRSVYRRPVVVVPCRPTKPVYVRKRCDEPIIRYIDDGYRLYQPRVHGHPAFLQRWSSYENRWVNIKEHPSVY